MTSDWLYKGNTRWRISTDRDEVITEWGNVNTGNTQTKRYKAKHKNVGRSNYVPSHIQAVREATALRKKKMDSGYAILGAEATHFLPMLAKDASKLTKWPRANKYYVQPKLDGIRAIVSKDGVFSRKGKRHPFTAGVEGYLAEGQYMDGELYAHGVDFQTLVSKVKTGDTDGIAFCCFDYYSKTSPELKFKDRVEALNKTTSWLKDTGIANVQIVPTADFTAKDLDHDQIQSVIDEIHNVYVDNGYEGVMIRMDTPYEVGKRSKGLLKYKNFITEEFKIVDYKECKKVGDAQPFKYVCELKDGDTFEVVPQYTQQQRCNEELFLTNIGKLLTVRFQEYTNAGKPRFGTGVSVRDYE